MPFTVTFSMCPYRDTWVISQKASAALKYMSGVGAEPSPPRFGPSSHANVLCAVPLWLTVASFKNGVTDVTSASNTISRRWMVGSRPSGSFAMASPRTLVAVMKTRRERSWREGPHPRDHRSLLEDVSPTQRRARRSQASITTTGGRPTPAGGWRIEPRTSTGPGYDATGEKARSRCEPREVEAPAPVVGDGRPQVAETRDALAHVVDPEVLDGHPARDLVPRHGRRHTGPRMRAHGVDRRQRAAPRVLVVVEQDARGRTARHLVLGRHEARVSAGELQRDRLGRHPHVLLRRPPHDRHVDVQALRARRLDVVRHPEAAQRLVDDERGLQHLCERRGAGIEVEVEIVGPIDVVAARVPLVEIDAAQVDEPQQRRHVLDDREPDDVAGVVLDLADLDPIRPR